MAECLSRLQLSRFCVGDCRPDEARAVEAHVDQCPACRAALARLQGNRERFDAKLDEHYQRFQDLRALADRPRVRSTRIWAIPVLGALAAAAVAIAVIVLWPQKPELTTQIKGTLGVRLVAQRDMTQFAVSPGTPLAAGDRIRFEISTDSPGYLAIFSIEAKGKLSAYYPGTDPSTNPAPLRIASAGKHKLPNSIVLDDYVGEERLVVLFSPDSFSRSELVAILGQTVDSLSAGSRTKLPGFRGEIRVIPIRKIDRSQDIHGQER